MRASFTALLLALLVTGPAFSQTATLEERIESDDRQDHRASYYKDGEIHVNVLGRPEGKPLTTGHWDFKPSWSKTGDMLVFFRRLKNDPDVSKWKTAICIINVDGTGFQQLYRCRTLYVANFDVKKRTITSVKPFANEEGKPIWFAYPRWTKDETAIVYHAGGKLNLYTLADGATKQVSTNDSADYRYPHGEATPK